ncbi:polyprenyl synthetase family protein [Xylanibacter ruminicola]|uniref:Octaprenyl-diphosphate synthase n=1 Tax=Xylanibacter ruminicola TaxID=839 RepID=A0A1M6XNU6_XYLRU|nr:polyprenyl synthetase family protein [Xylanibacter ruminicola]SHL07634.1 octaprenyl-diphosphate synthase [Xylanibacter ruminicola]
MDYLSTIRKPIEGEMNNFIELFKQSLSQGDGMLESVLSHIRQRGGKRMRPMLILLTAKNYGDVSDVTQNAALGLELLHTASLVHDDVVDESDQRRGQPSVNASYNNKVAVLVGDYILSTALLRVALSDNHEIVQELAELGRTLAAGEILQLSNISNQEISEDVYYQVINKKTAVLFEACCKLGAISVGAPCDVIEKAAKFGHNIGMIFQIRDDIFDYYDSAEIGKPTGNDMLEGKLTLPIIYTLNQYKNDAVLNLAKKVKAGTINQDEIAVLIEFAKQYGGIKYAEKKMEEFAKECQSFIDECVKPELKDSFKAYLDYVIQRNK